MKKKDPSFGLQILYLCLFLNQFLLYYFTLTVTHQSKLCSAEENRTDASSETVLVCHVFISFNHNGCEVGVGGKRGQSSVGGN